MIDKLIAFLKSLLFGPEPQVVEVTDAPSDSTSRKTKSRNHYQLGGQQDPHSYWLLHSDGTTFSGTPAEFGRFEAKRRGVKEVEVNRESIIVYLLAEKAKGKIGSRKGWKLQ